MGKNTRGLDFINEANKEFGKKEIQIISDFGKEYTIVMNTKIRDSEIPNIINELVDNSKYCAEKGIRYNMIVDMYAILIKTFTDIKFSTYNDKGKQIKHQMDVCESMIDLGAYSKIAENFDESSVKKIQNSFDLYKESFKTINNNIIKNEIKSIGE